MVKAALEDDLAKIYVEFYLEQGYLHHNPAIEPLESFQERQQSLFKESISDLKERLASSIEHILSGDILDAASKQKFKTALDIPQEDQKFWTALAEGKPLFELLNIPFETLLLLYDQAQKEINEGLYDSALNLLLLLTILCPLMSQFWLCLGIATYSIQDYPASLIHFLRAVALSPSDRDEVVALLWCYDALKEMGKDKKAKEIKQLVLDIIQRNTDLDDLKQIALNKS